MPARNEDYHLIAVLHDQLEDIESYNRYLKEARGCPACVEIWTRLRTQAEQAVALIRAEIQRHAEE